MKIGPKLKQTQKQIQEQVEIHETLRTRCLEVVNSEDQVIARIGEETTEPDENVSQNKIAMFFDHDGNKIACLEIDSWSIPSFNLFGKDGVTVEITGDETGAIRLTNFDKESGEITTLTISPYSEGVFLTVWGDDDDIQKSISISINVEKGKIEIDSEYENYLEQKKIKTSKTIFKSAE